MAGQVKKPGPTNLADLTPSFRKPLRRNLLIAIESPFYFRMSLHDGLYSIDRRVLLSGQDSTKRFVGANPGVVVNWQVSRHLNIAGAITRFLSGSFLSETFVANGFGFYSVAFTYRF